MRLCVALAFLCVVLPAGYGLKCYYCFGVAKGDCTKETVCAREYNRCASISLGSNKYNYDCQPSSTCNAVSITCCSGDLCNGAKPSTVFIPLLLAPLAIITFVF